MLATKSPVLQMLNEKVDILTLSPIERKLYESRMKLKSDIATISENQFNAGREEGKSLGLAEGKHLVSPKAKHAVPVKKRSKRRRLLNVLALILTK